MNYDVIPGELERTGLLASDLAAMVSKEFKGKRVLFLADCCHSGGLARAAEALAKSGIQAASLTSADATATSTVNWTFTQTVIDALEGTPFADKNGDGVLSLEEYTAGLAKKENAEERFKNFDTNHDGVLSEEEFIKAGKP